MISSSLIDVIVPCQYLLQDGCPCEEDVKITVEYTPPERETRDYPGTGESWEVVEWLRCHQAHLIENTEQWSDMKARAIHAAKEARP